MTVKRLLEECDSREISEWYAYDQRWPISDGWMQTARLCRVVMAASGNYKRVPEEEAFMPVVVKRPQDKSAMESEMERFAEMMASRKKANDGE